MTETTHKIDEQSAAVIDTTEEDWDVRDVPFSVLEKQANDALAYPDVMGEYS